MLKSALFSRLGSSTKQIDLEDITGGILKLPGNRYRLVLSASSINFELKSAEEQDAIIDTYEGFLNSITFAFQVLIRTREIDMDSYLDSLQARIGLESLLVYKLQLENYRHFISSLISDNKILSHQFYIVIAFDQLKKQDPSIIKDQLNLRADIVSKNLARLGIVCKELSSIEIIDLFYSFYSPEQAKTQPISERALQVMNQEFILKESNAAKA